jgi:hypothetical protein
MLISELANMKTQREIEAKVIELRDCLAAGAYSDAMQAKNISLEIRRLKWVLGVGPDVITVPKPATAPVTATVTGSG